MTALVLAVEDLAVHFTPRAGFLGATGPPVKAVDGVSFAIAESETLGLVGESGCGKSTVSNAIVGLLRPTRGSILVAGREVAGAGRQALNEVRRHVQMIFQDPALSLNPRMTVGAAVGEPLAVRGLARGRALKERVGELLRSVGLKPEHAARFPHQFSGGQRQRIVIARALALEPALVVCDEPVSALDVSVRAQILNLLVDLQRRRGMAYLFVSHDLAVVRHICDRVAVMYLGRLVEVAARETLFADPKHPYTQALMSAVPEPDPEKQRQKRPIVLTGELPSPSNVPSGCPFHTRCPRATDFCPQVYPPLTRAPTARWWPAIMPERGPGTAEREDESAPTEERIVVEGLGAEAEIVVDHWGIPHLRAQSLPDLFFLQGFNAARDRLWQIDLWHKRGLGLLAADFGPGFLAQDRASRLFLYRGDMAAEWAAYGPDAKCVCTAFTAGINAFVALTEREPERLPPEFGLMGTRPARWSPEDVVRIRSHGLTRNALSEVLRANVLARADEATDLLRKALDPPVTPRLPDGLDLADVPLDALDVFKLATASVTFTPERLAATLEEAWTWTGVTELGEVTRDEGSNNWAVHGSRTATGRPILASDPHRAHAVPSVRYIVHLTAPGFDAIGAGEPAVPGISIGHNGRIAFGLTIFGTDQEDVYVYETEPDDPNAYRYGDGWEPMRVQRERIAVKGAPDQEVVLKFTRHGPVVRESPGRRSAIAVRSVWFEPGSAAYLVSLASMRARTFQEFRDALRSWGAPSVNQIYADTEGTVAWLPVGRAPLRPSWDGLLPVPGDGRYEWAGFIDPERFPCVIDPPRGFVATANELNLPPDWPHRELSVGFEWAEASRAARIGEVLDADGEHTVGRSGVLQTDDLSIPAQRLCRLLAPLAPGDGDAAQGLALLGPWDHRLAAESAPAALFEIWWTKHLKPALLARLVPDSEIRSLLVPGDVESILAILEAPKSGFGPVSSAARDALLLDSLAEAWRDCVARMGAPAHWAWGRLHHGYFEHALTSLNGRGRLDVGPLPKGGSGSTPMHSGYRPSDFRITTGASFRMVVDVGDWDRSLCINAPGQSGDPRSPHYRDLAPLWASGRYVPMLYTPEAVVSSAKTRLILQPVLRGACR